MIEISVINEYQIKVVIGKKTSIKLNKKMQYFCEILRKKGYRCLASYNSILIRYNPLEITDEALIKEIKHIYSQLSFDVKSSNKIVIPTLYNGIDLEYVAKYNGLSIEAVIHLHSTRTYYVYMLGFTPGFAYLSDVDSHIATPRLNKPRIKIPKGSVGIANQQTGIYPVESPGGWRIIGQTPIDLFDLRKEHPFLINPGDQVAFKPITKREYIKIKEAYHEKH